MKKWRLDDSEFFVGYLQSAPAKLAVLARTAIAVLSLIALLVVTAIAVNQKKFSTATFEYGIQTSLEGYIFSTPFPHLKIYLGENFEQKEIYQTVLLVGFGKAGADSTLHHLGMSEDHNGSKVRVTGSLIYGDGKSLLQVDEESNLDFMNDRIADTQEIPPSEIVSLAGEIVDPKCYFGVMKPGEGKTHRSCAIRCISGGIPAVFHSDSLGYYLLLDEQKRPLSKEVLNIVGDHITLRGAATNWNDWTVLSVNSKLIEQLSAAKKLRENLLAFEEGMTQCN
jgi:hypothetical protein